MEASSPASTTAEHLLKDVVHVHASKVLTSATSTPSLLVFTDAFLSLLVVDASLFLVRQGLVGIGNLLELLLSGIWVILVLIGMVLDRQLLEGFLDLLV